MTVGVGYMWLSGEPGYAVTRTSFGARNFAATNGAGTGRPIPGCSASAGLYAGLKPATAPGAPCEGTGRGPGSAPGCAGATDCPTASAPSRVSVRAFIGEPQGEVP